MLRMATGILWIAMMLAIPAAWAQNDSPVWFGETEGKVDSLGRAPRLGEGRYQDPEMAAPAADDFSGLFMAPTLGVERHRLQDILRENLLLDDTNESWERIFTVDASLALDLFQLRGEEYPHYHPASDLWVYIWRGRGRLAIPAGESDYAPGDIIQIPAGTTHAFHNLSGAPTVALVWQRPAIDPTMIVEFVPEDVLERMRLDSLRQRDLEERSLYRSP